MRDRFPVVLGTMISQTMLNLLALVVLGSVMFATVGLFKGNEDALMVATVAPVVVLAIVLSAPWLPSRQPQPLPARAAGGGRLTRDGAGASRARRLSPPQVGRLGRAHAAQRVGRFSGSPVTRAARGLGLDERAGLGAAAAVLFAVNVTAALPITPSNLGVFQAACVAVLSAYGVGKTDVAYGIILQAVEIATLAMGMPALVREDDLEGPAPARAARGSGGAARVRRHSEPAEADA